MEENMTRKIYCDKCGEEIKFGFLKHPQEYKEPIKINEDAYDLCADCYNSFNDWRKEK